MALLTDLRHLCNDLGSGEEQRWTDDTLNTFLGTALDDVNIHAGTSFTIAALDALKESSQLDTVSYPVYVLTLRYTDILLLQQILGEPSESGKFVTQDTTLETTNISNRLRELYRTKLKEFDFRLRKWIGVDFASFAGLASPVAEF